MTDTSFDGTWALIMEGDERGAAAGIAFIRAAAAAVHPDLAPVKHGMIDLDAYPDIVIEGGAAWRADSPDARGTCQIDGDMATVEMLIRRPKLWAGSNG